jgi:SAM-dependent methyltransferase
VYDSLAPIYDRIMSHVEYDAWARLIGRITDRFLKRKDPSILELGGGTGVLAALLMEGGSPYVGSDRNFYMCRIAHTRHAPFACADALALPFKRAFDLIVFLYDGINYLFSDREYARLFSEAARCLATGGLFLFDITTEANSLHHFRSYLEFEDWGDFAYTRRSYYCKEKTEQHNDFTIFRRLDAQSQLYEKRTEHHCQLVFDAETIASWVPREQFSIEGIWDGFSFRSRHAHSERVHFLLRRLPS